MRYASKSMVLALATFASIGFSGCTKHVPGAPVVPTKISFSRVGLLETIPAVVAGGSVLPLQFPYITGDGNARVVTKIRRSERFVRFSFDGGVNFEDAGPLPLNQREFEWDVPMVDTTTALVQLVARSTLGGVDVLLASSQFEIRTNGSVLSQDRVRYYHVSNTNDVILGGRCESPGAVTVATIDATPVALGQAACASNRWEFTVSSSVDGRIGYRMSATDSQEKVLSVDTYWTRDTVAPLISPSSLQLAAGAAQVSNNYVPTALDASDSATNVTHFCLAYAFNASSVDSPPEGCWVAVNDPDQPALMPDRTLVLRDFLYRLGYVGGNYGVSAWVRDAAGNVSSRVDTTVLYQPGVPPSVVNVLASRTDPLAMPFSPADLNIAQGSPVIIRWKIASATNGLTASPVSLYYTQDDETFTPIELGIAEGPRAGCGLSDGLFSGCYVWNSTVPSTSYFRVRVAIMDRNGMVSSSSTNPLNGNGLSLIAGNTDAGVGGSAQAAIFLSPRFGYVAPDSGSLAVSNRGNIFFRDFQKGILWVQPSDGIVRVLMPLNALAGNVYEGPLSSPAASVVNPLRIALDFENGLLVWDYDRIRRIDLDSMTVSTLIGGGGSSADNVGPREVQFEPRSGMSSTQVLTQMIPLPNGNVLFESENYYTNLARLRVYSRFNEKVTSIQASGNGHGDLPPGVETDAETEDLALCSSDVNGVPRSCYRSSFVAEFHPVSSVLQTLQLLLGHRVTGNMLYALANLVPTGAAAGTSLAPHPPSEGYQSNAYARTVGRNGRIYAVNRLDGRISRFDKGTNAWVKIIGAARPGTCVDGTPALSCAIQPSDAFVDSQGNLFFLDRGQVRTVDGANRVITVYGQSHFFGDGGLAQSARFNVLPDLDQGNNGEVVVIDTVESRIRAFVPGGNIQTLAGDGTVGVRANLVDPAVSQPFSVSNSGNESSGFALDPVSNDVFSTIGSTVVRLLRSTGKWEAVANLPAGGYVPNLLGFDGVSVLAHSNRYDATILSHADSYFRFVGVNGVVSAYAGVAGAAPPQFCADGTTLPLCGIPRSIGGGVSKATWDAPRQRWLAAAANATRVVSLGRGAGATLETLKTVTRAIASFAYANTASGENLYYCASDGRIYRSDLTTGLETALEWRIPSMRCRGASMVYRASTNSLIVPVEQSGLYGVGEYVLPP